MLAADNTALLADNMVFGAVNMIISFSTVKITNRMSYFLGNNSVKTKKAPLNLMPEFRTVPGILLVPYRTEKH
jgi:hypothetical protein